jgi:hypothetical protein
MNLTDLATGIKMGSYVHPAGSPQKRHLIPWEQMRANLRLAFSRWGLPDRIRTDRDRHLVAPGEYPVPMPFTVWLAGLGIQHEIIQRVTQNGGYEFTGITLWYEFAGNCAMVRIYGDSYQPLQFNRLHRSWHPQFILPSLFRGNTS